MMARGISEIIAVLMMIVIVSSISLVIYVYSVGLFTGTTSAFREKTNINIMSLREKFIIVDVLVRVIGDNSIIHAAVYNYGKTDIVLNQMFINGTKAEVEEIKLSPNSLIWFNGTIPLKIFNSTFNLRIVSKLGNYHEILVYQ
ncbi:MAG: hypothetical protein NZ922_03855 [Candidatus Methanomethyliaceae archaeon]|nr:hypothetical protein [Candidatus Methanomethyliaceae archaeon]MDW7971207.1 hypothetical protein [Nitrososphaerota archaeon]